MSKYRVQQIFSPIIIRKSKWHKKFLIMNPAMQWASPWKYITPTKNTVFGVRTDLTPKSSLCDLGQATYPLGTIHLERQLQTYWALAIHHRSRKLVEYSKETGRHDPWLLGANILLGTFLNASASFVKSFILQNLCYTHSLDCQEDYILSINSFTSIVINIE